MLRLLRNKKTAKKIWIILAIIVVPAFCLWGGGAALRDRQKSDSLGMVFGKPISAKEFIRSYKALRTQYLIRLGREELAKSEEYLNLEAQAWERIILLAEARQNRIRASDKEVVNLIQRFAFFQREGVFDPQLYREVIIYGFGVSPREFEEGVRDDLILAKLFHEITKEINLTEQEIRRAYVKENEQISLDYIYAPTENFLDEVSLEEPELLGYYRENSRQFTQPLSFNVEYIALDSNNRQLIDEIAGLVSQGLSLQEAAGQSGLELKQTGLFSTDQPIPQIGWSTEISKILANLKPKGEPWPKPVLTDPKMAYFVGLKERKEPHIPAFEDIKDKVSQRLRREKANQIAKQKLDSCLRQAEASGFAEAAAAFNLISGGTELFSRNSYVEGLGDSDLFFQAVDDLEAGRISRIISASSGLYIVKVKQRIEPDEEGFQDQKQEFAGKLLGKKKEEYFKQYLSELKSSPNTFFSKPPARGSS